MKLALTAAFTAAAFVSANPVAAQDDGNPPSEQALPDFSAVTTQEALQALAETGELVPIYLFPPNLGGPEIEQNQVYVTPAAAESNRLLVLTIEKFVADGLLNQMDVRPEYRGDSLVPSKLVFEAWNTEGDGRFEPSIEVW